MSTSRKVYTDILFFCVIALVVVIFSEGPIRWLWSLVPVSAYISPPGDNVLVAHPYLKYIGLPGGGHGEVDQNGYFYNKHIRDTYEFIALGDSLTEGSAVMSWPRSLGMHTGKNIYNMGVRGYAAPQYLYQMDKALTFHPKTIMVAMNLSRAAFNTFDVVYSLDAWKDYRTPGLESIEGVTSANVLKKTHFYLKDQRDFLRKHSAIYAFLGNKTRIVRERLGLASPLTIGTTDWSTTDPDASLRYEKVPSQSTLFWASSVSRGVNLGDKNVAEGNRLMQVFASELAKKASANGVVAVIIVVPSKELVYAKKVGDDGAKNIFYRKIIADEEKMRQDLLAQCTKEHILCYDMLPYLEQKLDKGEVMYRNTSDLHPTPHGYEVYAAGVEEYLRSKNLL